MHLGVMSVRFQPRLIAPNDVVESNPDLLYHEAAVSYLVFLSLVTNILLAIY